MKPVMTEKAVMMIEAENVITFVTSKIREKAEIKKEIEELFDVKIAKIRTLIKDNKKYVESVETIHNPNWPYISDHPDRILMTVGAGSDKTNVLLILIKQQRPNVDKIYLYYLKIHLNQSINYLSAEEKNKQK